MIKNMFFAQPNFLWFSLLIPIFILLYYFFLHKRYENALAFANFHALKRIANKKFIKSDSSLLVLRVIVITFFVLALANLTVVYDSNSVSSDFVFALDTSASMLATDILPTRLNVAKDSITTFVSTLNASAKLGLVSFSGVSYIQQPLSYDHLPLIIKLSSLSSSTSGSDISGALIASANVLESSTEQKEIILLTDGADTTSAFNPELLNSAISYVREKNIIVNVVGLGSESGVNYLSDDINLTSSINKDQLILIAQQTGGEISFPSSSNELDEFFNKIQSPQSLRSIQLSLQNILFALGLILLVLEWILANTKFKKVI